MSEVSGIRKSTFLGGDFLSVCLRRWPFLPHLAVLALLASKPHLALLVPFSELAQGDYGKLLLARLSPLDF